MIKDWFFSKNGKVLGPFTLSDAKLYLGKNPHVYGWHPSLIHWKPVNCIDEFSGLLPPTVQGPVIPKEISDQFIAKKKKLENRLNTLNTGIKNTNTSIGDFDEAISAYKSLTKNLAIDVKNVVNKIETKNTHLKQQLSHIKESVNVANNEVLAVVDDFNKCAQSNDVAMSSVNIDSSQNKIISKKTKTGATVKKENLQQKTQSNKPKPDDAATEEILQKKTESQQFYRGVAVDAPDRVESLDNKPAAQKMYRGVPIQQG